MDILHYPAYPENYNRYAAVAAVGGVAAMYTDDDIVLISAIEHYAYCPRQFGLIHLEQVYEENVFTLQGQALHERADEALTSCEEGKRVERALPLWSDRYGLLGKADVVEFYADGRVWPVEYKRGAPAAAGQRRALHGLLAAGRLPAGDGAGGGGRGG